MVMRLVRNQMACPSPGARKRACTLPLTDDDISTSGCEQPFKLHYSVITALKYICSRTTVNAAGCARERHRQSETASIVNTKPSAIAARKKKTNVTRAERRAIFTALPRNDQLRLYSP